MEEVDNFSSDENLKRRAYLLGLRLKNSGLDEEAIYARLEKDGIPMDLARKVATDIINERSKKVMEESKSSYNVSLVRIGIGIAVAIISSFFLPGQIIIPIGIIFGGILLAIYYKGKTNEK